MKLAIVTPSFSRDAALCAELCRSVDEFETSGMEHILVVPKADMPLFAPLAGGRRRIIPQEPYLPAMTRVPLPTMVTIPGLYQKRLRKIWVTRRGQLVRGWIMQQILKMTCDRFVDADGVIFTDSDVVFVRPFGAETFLRNGDLLFYREPNALDPSRTPYQTWQDVACELLGQPRFPFNGENFISNMVTWRIDRLKAMQAAIEAATGKSVVDALIGLRHLSEYVVYGVFCQHGAGGLDGLAPQPRPLALEDWAFDHSTTEGMAAFRAGIAPHHIAVLMQSTNEWSITERREIVADITRHIHA
ncbi:MAG: DUF6492 family protein [Pseudomonadota bacterium]